MTFFKEDNSPRRATGQIDERHAPETHGYYSLSISTVPILVTPDIMCDRYLINVNESIKNV